MGKRDEIEFHPAARNRKASPDDFAQLVCLDKLRDGQLADRDDELRLEQSNFAIHPRAAIGDFFIIGHAVTGTFRMLARKTAADSGHINIPTKNFLPETACFLEPTKERFTRSPSERAAEERLARAGRLSDEHDLASHRSARDGGRFHARTFPAGVQLRDMRAQSSAVHLPLNCGGRFSLKARIPSA